LSMTHNCFHQNLRIKPINPFEDLLLQYIQTKYLYKNKCIKVFVWFIHFLIFPLIKW
jgi:hypothetical protein